MKKILSIVCALCVILSAVTVTAFAEKKSFIFLECVSVDGQELIVDLCVKDTAELGIKSFGIYLSYSSNVSLAGCDFNKEIGTPTFYDIMDEPTDELFIIPGIPCRILWTSVNDSVGKDKVAVGRFTFLSPDAPIDESDIEITLSLDFANIPKDASGNEIDTTVSFLGMDIVGGVIPELPRMDPLAGDANLDEKVSLADAALMLQYIANWQVGLDLDNADVNDDGDVTLSDVSLVLKYIAGWDIELK